MASYKAFTIFFVPFLALWLALLALDFAIGGHIEVLGFMRPVFTETAGRMNRFWSGVAALARKWTWFLPIAVLLFMVSPVLAVLFAVWDIFQAAMYVAFPAGLPGMVIRRRRNTKLTVFVGRPRAVTVDGVKRLVNAEALLEEDLPLYWPQQLVTAFGKLPKHMAVRVGRTCGMVSEDGPAYFQDWDGNALQPKFAKYDDNGFGLPRTEEADPQDFESGSEAPGGDDVTVTDARAPAPSK